MRDRETERDSERQRETERDRERDRERDTHRDRERDIERQRQTDAPLEKPNLRRFKTVPVKPQTPTLIATRMDTCLNLGHADTINTSMNTYVNTAQGL